MRYFNLYAKVLQNIVLQTFAVLFFLITSEFGTILLPSLARFYFRVWHDCHCSAANLNIVVTFVKMGMKMFAEYAKEEPRRTRRLALAESKKTNTNSTNSHECCLRMRKRGAARKGTQNAQNTQKRLWWLVDLSLGKGIANCHNENAQTATPKMRQLPQWRRWLAV